MSGDQGTGGAVRCAQEGCGHGYPEHQRGGRCADPCPCPGFRWVPAQGPAVSYGEPPRRP